MAKVETASTDCTSKLVYELSYSAVDDGRHPLFIRLNVVQGYRSKAYHENYIHNTNKWSNETNLLASTPGSHLKQ